MLEGNSVDFGMDLGNENPKIGHSDGDDDDRLPIDLLDSDYTRFALSLYFLVGYVSYTVVILFRRDNPMNKITMWPYYTIITFQVLYCIYYIGIILQERAYGARDLRWYLTFS